MFMLEIQYPVESLYLIHYDYISSLEYEMNKIKTFDKNSEWLLKIVVAL